MVSSSCTPSRDGGQGMTDVGHCRGGLMGWKLLLGVAALLAMSVIAAIALAWLVRSAGCAAGVLCMLNASVTAGCGVAE